jgi:hypothetical protein
MNNFSEYLTPIEAKRLIESVAGSRKKSLGYYYHLAKSKKKCFVCETEKVWRLADTGMCFSCSTGENDASGDYELIQL